MRLVDARGRLIEVQVRESARARTVRAVYRYGDQAELVVPVGTSERAIDRALREHAPWLASQAERAPRQVLDLPRLSEHEGRRVARELVTETARTQAPRVGAEYGRIAIRDTRSRWGSCSSNGTLSFSWRLALAPRSILDYVVVHELCHLVHHDHSPRFWFLLGRIRPTYRDERRWLSDHGWELLAYRPAHDALGDV